MAKHVVRGPWMSQQPLRNSRLTSARLAAFACLSLVCIHTSAAQAQVRTWTDLRGRQMEAEFQKLEDDHVHFLKGGKVFQFPLERLSTKDQIEVARLAAQVAILGTTIKPENSVNGQPPSRKTAPLKKPLEASRTWTDIEGNTYTGVFVRLNKGGVVIRSGVHEVEVPLTQLSAADRELLTQHLAATRQEDALPGPAISTSAPTPDVAPNLADSSGVIRPLNLNPEALEDAIGFSPTTNTMPSPSPAAPPPASTQVASIPQSSSQREYPEMAPMTPPDDMGPAPNEGDAKSKSGFDYGDPYFMANANKEDGFGHFVMGACAIGLVVVIAALRLNLFWRAWNS